jgi:DNA-binding NarL/FixJ family response regulator
MKADISADVPSMQILSAREQTVFRLIVLGKNTKQISGELNLSIKTVSTYRKRLLNKLGVRSTAGLVAYALRNNILW